MRRTKMKKIEAVIRPNKVSDVCSAVEKLGHYGLMISEIEGFGKQQGIEQQVRGRVYKVKLMTKARLELIVKDKDVKDIIEAIRNTACTGEVGDGKIFIYPVDDAVRVRTAEQGDAAI
jgi:nitrogen regulatory protein P-II 1